MEYQDYNDNNVRYSVEGYKKQVKRKIQDHDRIIRHFNNQRKEARTQLQDLYKRLGKVEGKLKMIENKLKKVRLEQRNLIISEDKSKIELINYNENKIYEQTKIVVQNANEREMLKSNVRFLKMNIYHIDKWIDEEKERRSKIVIS